mgnify:FL=1
MSERIPVRIYEDSLKASQAVARRIAQLIRERTAEHKPAVLGLATGNTPVNVYRELVRLHQQEGLDFSNVVTFNLDEYWPIDHEALQSYHLWMHENLFKHINISPENIHIPSGVVDEDHIAQYCRQYEEAIRDVGGIDLQLLGIGRSGHIGFNEPGSEADSRTRRVTLDKITRMDAASDFFGEENVPMMAITMGVGTILDARQICLMAFGEHKAPIVRQAIEGEVSNHVVASYLQHHPDTTVYADASAAGELTHLATPWLEGHCEWDDMLVRRAVIWLSRKQHKPILKLTDEDYTENGLGQLNRERGGAYNINLHIFRHMMNTVTGWPGGKHAKRRILVLSPHPDDDVICMAGTMTRLAQQGHEVHIAYMVAGYLSVFDHLVMRYADFVTGFSRIFGQSAEETKRLEEKIDQFLRQKQPGEVDTREVQEIKALIRRTEAVAAADYCDIPEQNTHFLNLPFYDTGEVQKLPVGQEDIDICRRLYETVRPELIFAAGDMSDPHGTHRLCLEATRKALDEYVAQGHPEPELWYYRGAWQEWEPEMIDMAVPLSPDELLHKRYAIFRHESQKDRAMFPGAYDQREFWQRAEDRNKGTAELYDALGLPEYHAIEAFVKSPIPRAAQTASQLIRNED